MAACLAVFFDAGNEFRALSRGKSRSQGQRHRSCTKTTWATTVTPWPLQLS